MRQFSVDFPTQLRCTASARAGAPMSDRLLVRGAVRHKSRLAKSTVPLWLRPGFQAHGESTSDLIKIQFPFRGAFACVVAEVRSQDVLWHSRQFSIGKVGYPTGPY